MVAFLVAFIVFALLLTALRNTRGQDLKKQCNNSLITKYEDLKKQILANWQVPLDVNSLLDVPIVYLNLDQSTDRREYMEAMFDGFELSPRPLRIVSVSGLDYINNSQSENWIAHDLHPLLHRVVTSKMHTHAEIGCLLSHMKCILHGYCAKLPALLVLEDDVDFSCVGLWKSSLSDLIRKAPAEWNFIQLYYECENFQANSDLTSTHDVRCTGCVAYLISARAISLIYHMFFDKFMLTRKLYDRIQEESLLFVSDIMLFEILKPRNKYIEHIPRFTTNNFKPELESTIHPAHTELHNNATLEIWRTYINQIQQQSSLFYKAKF
jgi:GR25 family glycosyltransferase involved in LPS biosynthesis